jgi:PadR family transcriptional regulator PadR
VNREDIARPRVLVGPWLLVLLAEGRAHGYELMDRMREVGFEWDGGSGPIYHELRLQQEAGLLRSSFEPASSGPLRNVYDVTPAGRAELLEMVGSLQTLVAIAGHLLDRIRCLDDENAGE